MGRWTRFRHRWPVPALLVGLLVAAALASPVGAGGNGLQALIVGGGPDPENNQVSIERHVHYVSRLLPPGTPRVMLFADGDPASKTVLFEEEPKKQSPGEHAFALLFGSREEAYPTVQRYRAPVLEKVDGPARRAAVARAFERLKQADSGSVLLYFAGHGSRARSGDLDNNVFDLWGERLSVRELAGHIASLPPEVPVTVVMVQCYSGAFGNLVFAGGDPSAAPIGREIAGFFATTRERMSAGCSPELNEAEYKDFSSYFFAALTGRDRVGRAVKGADYNKDGRVGMDEAFAYSLINDHSIDVPVCTSDVFLRRVVSSVDEELFRTPYSRVRSWATPAQGAALDALSAALKLSNEERLSAAYRMVVSGEEIIPMEGDHENHTTAGSRRGARQATRRFRQVQDEMRRPLLERWPDVGRRDDPGYAAARKQVIAELNRRDRDGRLRELLQAEEALSRAEEQEYQAELAEAQMLRLVRLAKSVILAHQLRETGDSKLRERFERLVAAEGRTPLPPATATARLQ